MGAVWTDWAGRVSFRDRKNRLPVAEDGRTSKVRPTATAQRRARNFLAFMEGASFPGGGTEVGPGAWAAGVCGPYVPLTAVVWITSVVPIV